MFEDLTIEQMIEYIKEEEKFRKEIVELIYMNVLIHNIHLALELFYEVDSELLRN